MPFSDVTAVLKRELKVSNLGLDHGKPLDFQISQVTANQLNSQNLAGNVQEKSIEICFGIF